MKIEPILRVRNLSVDINHGESMIHPVRDVSFDLAHGQTLGIAGESGSGKSLMLMALLGLLPRNATRRATEVRFDAKDLTYATARQMQPIMATGIATIFQDPMTCLNPVLSIGALLEEVYRHHRGGTRAAARDRAVEMLERVAIPNASDRLRQYPHELSGGLRQRVMIAMALMCAPKLLIADEPTTALDVTVQSGILDLLDQLQRDLGLAVILVSHDLGVIGRLSHNVAVMYGGQIVEMGPTKPVLSRPQHPYTQALLRCIPGIKGANRANKLMPIPGQVSVMAGDLTGCQFRDRCRFAAPCCVASDPAPREVLAGWNYRCHFRSESRVPVPEGMIA